MSPEQLYITGTLKNANTSMKEIDNILSEAFLHWVMELTMMTMSGMKMLCKIYIRSIDHRLSQEIIELINQIDPLQDDGNYGIDTYKYIVQLLST